MTVFIVTVSLMLVVLTVSLIIMAAQVAALEDTVEKIYAMHHHPALRTIERNL